MIDDSDLARLLSLVKRRDDGCWIYTRYISNTGYGHFQIRGQRMLAHRASYVLHKGAIPHGMCVCHTCDVRSCLNPDHLFLGTHLDNVRDMLVKGRQATRSTYACRKLPRGDDHWSHRHPELRVTGPRNGKHTKPECTPRGSRVGGAKLSEEMVREILSRSQAGETGRSIARRFGVTAASVSGILCGHTWRHVTRGDTESPVFHEIHEVRKWVMR